MTKENLKPVLSTFMEQVWNNGNFSQIEKLIAPRYEIKKGHKKGNVIITVAHNN